MPAGLFSNDLLGVNNILSLKKLKLHLVFTHCGELNWKLLALLKEMDWFKLSF